jgi:hypothetical protein
MKNIAMKVSLAFLLLTLSACAGTGSGDRKPSLDLKDFSLNHQQILKHLRTANEVSKEVVKSGHPPFGAVLGPTSETWSMALRKSQRRN